jgi:hypothetical protein
MQNFSKESLTIIKKALVMQITLAKTLGLATYTQDAQDVLNIVNEYLRKN